MGKYSELSNMASALCGSYPYKDVMNILLGAISFFTAFAFSIQGCVSGKKGSKRHEAVFVMSTIGGAIYLASFILKFLLNINLWVPSEDQDVMDLITIIILYLPYVSYAFLFLVIGTFVHIVGSVGLRAGGHKKRANAMSVVTLLFCVIAFLVTIAIFICSVHTLFMSETEILYRLAYDYLQKAFVGVILFISINLLGNTCGYRAAFGGFTAIIVSVAIFWIFAGCEQIIAIVDKEMNMDTSTLPSPLQRIVEIESVLKDFSSPYVVQIASYFIYHLAEIPSTLILLGCAAAARSQMKYENLFKESKKGKKAIKTDKPADLENQGITHTQITVASATEIEKSDVQPGRSTFTPVKMNISSDRKKQIAANQAAAVAF